MMELSPAQLSPSIQSSDNEHLSQALDKALERYLNLLDKYQKLQRDLAGILAKGNLSLAQANFSSPTRIRYGSDFYDERMQATRKIAVKMSPTSAPIFEHNHHPLGSAIEPNSATDMPGDEKDPSEVPISDARKSKSRSKLNSRDPLRWFGMFVPPALRSAQSSFSQATSEVIPTLASVAGDLSLCGKEIGMIRAELDAGS